MLLMGSCRRLTRDTSRNEKDDGWGWSSKTAGLLLTAMGTGITLPAWTAKTLDRIHEMTASEVGQRATSERKEHESESCDCPAWGLVAASTQQHKRRNPNGAHWSHHIEEIEIRVHGARIFMAEYWRQGACAESALEICRYVGWSSTRLRKEPMESNKPNNLWNSHRAGKSSHSHLREWRDLIIHRALDRIFRRVMP